MVHGTGLIGGSIALALRGAGWSVAGWDPDPTAIDQAMTRGALDRVVESPAELVNDVELIVLAGPAEATIDSLARLETEALVTDIASIKTPIVAAGTHLPSFVPGHPMAGSAASGANHASSHLFQGASWVLCVSPNEDAMARMTEIVQSFGANPVVMTGAQHDRYVAMVSHLPRVLASSLVELVASEPEARQLTAGSFRDLTRVATSNPDWWADVIHANSEQLGIAVDGLIAILQEWKDTTADVKSTRTRLGRASEERSHMGAPVAEVRVVLFDRPGEVARVGISLAESGVDLRDIQLRHAEHGGGGILTLSVNENATQGLRAALAANGFEMEPD